MSIVLITGGFDPIHSGHLSYIYEARKFGEVFIGLNSDDWLVRKKGTYFLSFCERKRILENIVGVSGVFGFDDSDGSAREAIYDLRRFYPGEEIVFCNGGDRIEGNIPEKGIVGVRYEFGVGGEEKRNSSSWILGEYLNRVEGLVGRNWGEYRVLREGGGWKLKTIEVSPGKSLSMQRHFRRSEFWMVVEGEGLVEFSGGEVRRIGLFDRVDIGVGEWHRLENVGEGLLRVIEIQYGVECSEVDIEREGDSICC